jgi:hypothetical protein
MAIAGAQTELARLGSLEQSSDVLGSKGESGSAWCQSELATWSANVPRGTWPEMLTLSPAVSPANPEAETQTRQRRLLPPREYLRPRVPRRTSGILEFRRPSSCATAAIELAVDAHPDGKVVTRCSAAGESAPLRSSRRSLPRPPRHARLPSSGSNANTQAGQVQLAPGSFARRVHP